MKRLLLAIAIVGATHASPAFAVSPVNVTVTQETINVTVSDDNGPVATITVPDTEIVQVVTAGEQGIPGAKGDKGDKGDPGDIGPAGADGVIGVDGAPGPPGADGAQGIPGPAGAAGADGARGYDGREIELQKTSTHIQWRYLADPPGPWADLVPLTAITGTNGIDGRTVLSGSGAPSNGLGANGDFYIDTAAAHLYGPKAAGAWPEIYTDLVGPQGPAGPEGPPGALPNQAALYGIIDDPTDNSTMWTQQGPTEQATNAKSGTKDNQGNAKQWIDGNGTVVRQCIAADSAPAFKMLATDGVTVLFSVACDGVMTHTGTVTIK